MVIILVRQRCAGTALDFRMPVALLIRHVAVRPEVVWRTVPEHIDGFLQMLAELHHRLPMWRVVAHADAGFGHCAISASALPRIRFHDLRHAHAIHMLANGVHPKVASERLGHSRAGVTLDLYSHVLPGMQEDAAPALTKHYGSL